MNPLTRRSLLRHALVLLLATSLVADTSLRSQTTYRDVRIGRVDHHPMAGLTWWTDIGDWMLAVPNVGIAYDLGNPDRIDTRTLVIGLRADAEAQQRLWRGQQEEGSDLRHWAAQVQYRWHVSPDRHPERRSGRFFIGPFAQAGYRHGLWGIGAAAGYDRAMIDYGSRHFLELQLGGDLGIGLRREVIGGLRLALAYRTQSIRRKYWQPDMERYARHRERNGEARRRMDSLVALMEADPICLHVPASGSDSILARGVDLAQIRTAFARRFAHDGLRPVSIEALSSHTPLPIMRPGEYCLVNYRMRLSPTDQDSEPGEETYLLPFRVRIEGYEEARARMQQLNDSLRQRYVRSGRQLPVLRLEPVSADSMAEAATPQQVLALLNEVWNVDSLRPTEVVGYFFRQDGDFVPVAPEQINRRGTYAVSLRLHPQVEEGYDSLVTRFVVQPRIAARDQLMYDRHRAVLGQTFIHVPHRWLNGREDSVQVAQLIAALDSAGWVGYEPAQLQCTGLSGLGRHHVMASYGPALPSLPLTFVVEDSVGLRMGTRLYEALAAGVDARHATWSPRYGNDPHGPLVGAERRALLDSISQCLTRIDPELRGLRIEEEWVEDYQYTGLHPLPATGERPSGEAWTILRFRYRLLYADGRPRIAGANVAYRIQTP